jgi:hypothetical protein
MHISDRQGWLFTGILPHGYNVPNSFCFDIKCTDDPIMVGNIFDAFFVPWYYRKRLKAVLNKYLFRTILGYIVNSSKKSDLTGEKKEEPSQILSIASLFSYP